MRATLAEIDHQNHRYPTVGDWIVDDGCELRSVLIVASRMKNPDYVFLIQLHELIEAYLCMKRAIPQAVVDDFDIQFEKKRRPGDIAEPGDDPAAPYHREHEFATQVEVLMAIELGVDWVSYAQTLDSL